MSFEMHEPSDAGRPSWPEESDVSCEIDWGGDGITASPGDLADVPDDPLAEDTEGTTDRVTDPELHNLLVIGISVLGSTERLDPLLRAAEHLNTDQLVVTDEGYVQTDPQ